LSAATECVTGIRKLNPATMAAKEGRKLMIMVVDPFET
jgi:hypothetical protein